MSPPRSARRWTWWLTVAVVELVVAATTLAVFAAARPATSGRPVAVQDPDQAQLRAVTAALDRHAAALRDRDRARFGADLDASSAARAFRSAQLAVFDNTADLRWSAWTYGARPVPVTGAPVETAARRLNGTVLVVRTSLRYGLAGADARPTEHPVWITAVLRGQAWRLAGDTDVADAGGVSWRGPWDFGPVRAYRRDAVTVLTHPRNAGRAAGVADDVIAALPAVTRVWGTGWARRAVVYVPDDQVEMSAVVGQGLVLDRFAAVAVADEVDTSTATALGQRVVVNPDALFRLNAVSRRLVLAHELTHIATRPVTGAATPTWLVEGFADYVGHRAAAGVPGAPRSVAATVPDLAAAVRAGRVPASLPTAARFDSDATGLTTAYDAAWTACRLIARLAGQDGLVRIYRQVASATDPADALGPALRGTVGLDLAGFTARWQADLHAELG